MKLIKQKYLVQKGFNTNKTQMETRKHLLWEKRTITYDAEISPTSDQGAIGTSNIMLKNIESD